MIYEMMIQTHTGYNDILNMSISEINGFFSYRNEQTKGEHMLTERQRDMIERNKKKGMGVK